MFTKKVTLAVGCTLAFGCTEQPSETQEIVDNLVHAGFPADDIMVVNGVVYVGRDAEVSLAASREMLQTGDSNKEQYHTTNLISRSLAKICIDGSTFTGVFSTALDLAIQNYDEQLLTFAMARTPSSGCSFTINAVIQPGVTGGVSGFPSGGLPFPTINIGDGLATFSVDTIEHVITHEIGHTIGFRHSDFFNRSISCGVGGNEGAGSDGAILIPGTPSGATVGGSIMNSCFRTMETGEFTATDLVALKELYGILFIHDFFAAECAPPCSLLKPIPDNDLTGVRVPINVSQLGIDILRITTDVNITHTFRGDLVIQVITPNGQTATLSNRAGGSADNFIATGLDITSSFTVGSAATGQWQLFVRDLAAVDVGTINTFALHIESTN